MTRFFRQDLAGERGASMVEYGLIVAVVALMSLSAATLVGERTEQTFDEVSAALGGDGTTVAPADEDEGGAGDDNSSDGEQNEDSTPPPDDPNPPQEDDDQQPQDSEEVTPPKVSKSSASTNGWKKVKGNKQQTEWDANVEYANATEHAQYLTLVVTTMEDNGKTNTETIENLEVPANGSAVFTHEGNFLEVNKGGKKKGTTSVEIQVVSVTTTGSNGQSQTVEVDQDPVSVESPTP